MKPLLAPLIFAGFATITAPIALLLNTFKNRSSKEKKQELLRRRLSYILFSFSSMVVGDLLAGGIGIPLSALVGLTSLLPYLRIAPVQHFLWDGRGNFHSDVRFIFLLTYPSDNYCVGAAHKRSKMD